VLHIGNLTLVACPNLQTDRKAGSNPDEYIVPARISSDCHPAEEPQKDSYDGNGCPNNRHGDDGKR
jgi:hypothetical protein